MSECHKITFKDKKGKQQNIHKTLQSVGETAEQKDSLIIPKKTITNRVSAERRN